MKLTEAGQCKSLGQLCLQLAVMKLGSPTEAGTQGPVVRCDLLSQ